MDGMAELASFVRGTETLLAVVSFGLGMGKVTEHTSLVRSMATVTALASFVFSFILKTHARKTKKVMRGLN
jgi:hypothetical protein